MFCDQTACGEMAIFIATSFYSVYDWHWRCCAFGVTSCAFIYFTCALLLKTHLRFHDSFLRFHSMALRPLQKSDWLTWSFGETPGSRADSHEYGRDDVVGQSAILWQVPMHWVDVHRSWSNNHAWSTSLCFKWNQANVYAASRLTGDVATNRIASGLRRRCQLHLTNFFTAAMHVSDLQHCPF